MDMQEFQDKMEPTHRAYFCRMLKMKDLPACLLERYAAVKMLTDRVDGFVAVGNLAMIAIDAGFNPETGVFPEYLSEEQAKDPEAAIGQPVEQTIDDTVDKAADDTVDKAVDESGVKAADESGVKASKTLLSAGMPVNVLQGEDLLEGKIVSIKQPEPGTQDPVKVTVELDNEETITVNEDEVDAA